jgi:hypothetical protein
MAYARAVRCPNPSLSIPPSFFVFLPSSTQAVAKYLLKIVWMGPHSTKSRKRTTTTHFFAIRIILVVGLRWDATAPLSVAHAPNMVLLCVNSTKIRDIRDQRHLTFLKFLQFWHIPRRQPRRSLTLLVFVACGMLFCCATAISLFKQRTSESTYFSPFTICRHNIVKTAHQTRISSLNLQSLLFSKSK